MVYIYTTCIFGLILVLCPPDWTQNGARSACYKLINKSVYALDGRDHCAAIGGYLASIYTLEEFDLVTGQG